MGTLTLWLVIAATLISVIILIYFELSKPKPEFMLPMLILTVAALLGRIIFTFIPQVQPSTVLIIIVGYYFGAKYGYVSGILVALISNMALGQGLWTPFQMLAWGIIGFVAAFIPHFKNKYITLFTIGSYSFLAAFFFSIVTDSLTVSYLGSEFTLPGAITIWGAGLIFNIPHALCNLLFTILFFPLLDKKLARIKAKY